MIERAVIVLAGSGGDLGGRIAKALVARGADVRALFRPGVGRKDLLPIERLGATTIAADPGNTGELARAMKGASCVVSALNGVRDVIIDRQSTLLEAAVKAGVPRFMPSDYAADFTKTRPGDNRITISVANSWR